MRYPRIFFIQRLIAWALILSIGLQDVLWASVTPTYTLSGQKDAMQGILSDPSKIVIPKDTVMLKEVFKGNSDKLIIHIQDAHSNFGGQMAIAKTIDDFMQRYEISLVLSEGGEGDASLGEIREIMDSRELQIAASHLLFKGLIAGHEYLNLTSDRPMMIYGVDDKDLYFQNLVAYEALAECRSKVLPYLHRIRISVNRLKDKLYPDELLLFEKGSKGYGIHETGGIEDLLKLSENLPIHWDNYPELVRLKGVMHKEEQLQAEEINVALDDLRPEAVLEQLEQLEDDIYHSLLPQDDHKILRAVEQFLSLLNRAYNIRMTSDDFRTYRDNLQDFDTTSWQSFINYKLGVFGYFENLIPYETYLEDTKPILEDFYSIVDARDVAFLKNSMSLMTQKDARVSILITGGYHTSHLTQLMRKANVSYVVLSPILEEETNLHQYEKNLLAPLRTGRRFESIDGTAIARGLEEGDALSLRLTRMRQARWRFRTSLGITSPSEDQLLQHIDLLRRSSLKQLKPSPLLAGSRSLRKSRPFFVLDSALFLTLGAAFFALSFFSAAWWTFVISGIGLISVSVVTKWIYFFVSYGQSDYMSVGHEEFDSVTNAIDARDRLATHVNDNSPLYKKVGVSKITLKRAGQHVILNFESHKTNVHIRLKNAIQNNEFNIDIKRVDQLFTRQLLLRGLPRYGASTAILILGTLGIEIATLLQPPPLPITPDDGPTKNGHVIVEDDVHWQSYRWRSTDEGQRFLEVIDLSIAWAKQKGYSPEDIKIIQEFRQLSSQGSSSFIKHTRDGITGGLLFVGTTPPPRLEEKPQTMINVGGVTRSFSGIQTTGDESLFAHAIVSEILRLAWETKLDQANPGMLDQARREYAEFDAAMKKKQLNERSQWILDNGQAIEGWIIEVFSPHYFATLRQKAFMVWAKEKGLYSPDKASAAAEELAQDIFFQTHYRFLKDREKFWVGEDHLAIELASAIRMKWFVMSEAQGLTEVWRAYSNYLKFRRDDSRLTATEIRDLQQRVPNQPLKPITDVKSFRTLAEDLKRPKTVNGRKILGVETRIRAWNLKYNKQSGNRKVLPSETGKGSRHTKRLLSPGLALPGRLGQWDKSFNESDWVLDLIASARQLSPDKAHYVHFPQLRGNFRLRRGAGGHVSVSDRLSDTYSLIPSPPPTGRIRGWAGPRLHTAVNDTNALLERAALARSSKEARILFQTLRNGAANGSKFGSVVFLLDDFGAGYQFLSHLLLISGTQKVSQPFGVTVLVEGSSSAPGLLDLANKHGLVEYEGNAPLTRKVILVGSRKTIENRGLRQGEGVLLITPTAPSTLQRVRELAFGAGLLTSTQTTDDAVSHRLVRFILNENGLHGQERMIESLLRQMALGRINQIVLSQAENFLLIPLIKRIRAEEIVEKAKELVALMAFWA
jgi:hypothetical protein